MRCTQMITVPQDRERIPEKIQPVVVMREGRFYM